MHELKIAEELASVVIEAAKKENLSRVTEVNISFGELVQIVPDIFRFAFSETVRDTLAENANVNIEIIQVRMRCIDCGNDFRVTNNEFSCDSCGSADIDITEGRELFVKSIEGE